MERIGIVTDSSCSLPPEIVKQYEIVVVPVSIQIGDRSFSDGVDLSPNEFYARIESGSMVTTSQPSPGEFLKVYRALSERVNTIISIHVTGRASGTVQAAHLARQAVPSVDIEVVDSGFTTMALGFMAMESARAALLGWTKEEILRLIEDLKSRIHVFAALPTLTYLRRSGRVGAGQALIASVLSVKPILSMANGVLEVVDRVRTYPRALTRMIELAERAVGDHPVRLSVLYTKTREQALGFAGELERRLRCVGETIVTEMGTALAVHGGPGMLGVAVMKVQRDTP